MRHTVEPAGITTSRQYAGSDSHPTRHHGIRPHLSVVVLCYAAETFVPEFVASLKRELDARGLRYELVLVANYDAHPSAQDRTPAVVSALAQDDPRIIVVSEQKQGMMGWDMRRGFAAATGDAVAVIDGDGQMRAKDVIVVYNVLCQGRHEMVKTYRTTRYDGALRCFVSVIYNFIFHLIFPSSKVHDVNSKPKILTREALQRLPLESDGWFIDAEIILRAMSLGYRIAEVPTVFYSNARRASYVRPEAFWEFVRQLVRFRFKNLRVEANADRQAALHPTSSSRSMA